MSKGTIRFSESSIVNGKIGTASIQGLLSGGSLSIDRSLTDLGTDPKKPGAKYRNRKVEMDGYTFDSEKEASRYCQLLGFERQGLISDLRLQVSFEISPAAIVAGRRRRPRYYIADFVYIEGGKTIVEDVKGMRTKMYLLKRHLMKTVHGIDIREV